MAGKNSSTNPDPTIHSAKLNSELYAHITDDAILEFHKQGLSQRKAAMKKRCEFQGGAGLQEKYRPPSPCLGEFLVGRPNNDQRQKYCGVCAPFAKKWLSAQSANAAYQREPGKYAKITRENRWKRRRAAGRPCPRLGVMVRCKYRDKGRRGAGCLRRFERKSSSQKFCAVCQKHADADRAQEYRDRYPEKEKARQTTRWKIVRQELAALRELRTGANVPQPAPRTRGPKIQQATKERITLAAQLEILGQGTWAMTDRLYPRPGQLPEGTRALDKRKRFEKTRAFLARNRESIDLKKQMLTAASL